MRLFGSISLAAVLLSGLAHAADLPSRRAPILTPVVTEKPEPVTERDAPMFPDLPPLRVETPSFVEPVVEPAPEPVAPEPVIEPRKEERPAALRDFKFVFPPLEDDKHDETRSAPIVEAPAVELEDKVEPLKPVEAKPASRFNLGWLRRNRDEAGASAPPERIEPEPFVEPEPAPQAEPEPVERETQIEVETVSVEIETRVEEAPAVEPVAEPIEEPAPAPASAPDPFSPDWLERALSGADEPPVPPAPRFVPPSQRRAAQAAEVAEPVLASEPVIEAPAAQESGEAPVEIGRYSANDVAYIMFSDGSITAETATGTYRFNSLIELKDFIERGA